MLLAIIFIILASSSGLANVYIFQLTYLMECVQMFSHFFVYGIYMKEIRRCLQKYKFYQRLLRMLHVRPNQIAPAPSGNN